AFGQPHTSSRIERAGGFEHTIEHSFAKSHFWALAHILPENVENVRDRRHGISQLCQGFSAPEMRRSAAAACSSVHPLIVWDLGTQSAELLGSCLTLRAKQRRQQPLHPGRCAQAAFAHPVPL